MNVPQEVMCRHAMSLPRRIYEVFAEIMEGPNPLTQVEVQKMIERRPKQYKILRYWTTNPWKKLGESTEAVDNAFPRAILIA